MTKYKIIWWDAVDSQEQGGKKVFKNKDTYEKWKKKWAGSTINYRRIK